MLTIKDMQERAFKTASDKGFHDNSREFGTAIALCHSELSEALEAHRSFKPFIKEVLRNIDDCHTGLYTYEDYDGNVYSGVQYDSVPDDAHVLEYVVGLCSFKWSNILSYARELQILAIGEELADTVIRIGDLAEEFEIDLQSAIELKQMKNKERPIMHGGKRY